MPRTRLAERVRAEVGALALVALAREVDAREVLVEADRDVGIGLVVAQPDVEPRLVLLDEVLLGEQRLGLGDDDERLDVVDLLASARSCRTIVGLREVAGDPLADRLRLADVDDAPAGVAEQVDARLVGQRAPLLANLAALLCGWGFDGHRVLLRSLERGPVRNSRRLLSVRDPMHRMRTTILLAALAALVLCAPASANYRVGLSEQDAAMFDQPALAGAEAQARPLHRPVGLLQGRRPTPRPPPS